MKSAPNTPAYPVALQTVATLRRHLMLAHSPVRLPPPHLPLTITVSVDVAHFHPRQIGDCASLCAAADQALYAAKRSGRIQVKAAMLTLESPERT